MVFQNGYRRKDINLKINGVDIEQVESFTYLGTTMYTNGNCRRTQQRVAKQAEKAIYGMRALQRKYYQNPVDKCQDFQCLVEPVLTYACQAWGAHRCNDVIKKFNQYHKRLLVLKPSTAEFLWALELGIALIRAKMDYRMVTFWATMMMPEMQHWIRVTTFW